MNGLKSAVVMLCVCSVCYSLMLRLVNSDTYKGILKTVFGMALIVVVLSSFSKTGFNFNYSAVTADAECEDINEFSSQLTLRIAEQDLEQKAREILKSEGIAFETIEITMDKAKDGSIVINKAEVVFSANNTSKAGVATQLLKSKLDIDFKVKEV